MCVICNIFSDLYTVRFFRNSMWPICSFAWATPLVRVSGRWRSPRIMARPGRLGSTFPIPPPIVRRTLARTPTSQLPATTTSSAPLNTQRLCRWRTARFPWCCSMSDPVPPTTSTQRCCRNGLVPLTSGFVCFAPRIFWDIWCLWLDKIPRWRVATSTRSRTSRSEEGACAMDTPTPVTSRTRRAQSASSHAVASITRAASSATSAVLDSSRKSGAKTPMPDHSTANVSIV